MLQVEMRRTLLNQVKCLKFKVPARLGSESVAGRPKVPKVKRTKVTITCFGPVFIGLKMG